MRVYLQAGLAVALVALGGCKTSDSKGVALASSMERYIPADTVVLAGVRVDQLKTTPLYQKLMEGQKLGELDQFAKRTGLDPRRDVDEFVLASNGKKSVAIARGRIANRVALEDAMVKEGATKEAFGKYNLVGKDGYAVVFVDDTIALAGQPELLKPLLEAEPAKGDAKSAVLERVAAMQQARQVWAVAIGGFAPVPLPETGNLANLNRVFQSLEDVAMTMDLKDGLHLNAAGTCNDEKNARQLHDLLRGLIGFGRLSTPSDRPDLLRLLDGIRVDHNNRNVKLDAQVPMELVDTLLATSEGKRPKKTE